MKYRIYLLLVFLLIVACSNDRDDLGSDVVVPVSIMEIHAKPIQQFFSTTATVNAHKEARLVAETVGYYRLAQHPEESRPIAMGDTIRAGQPIAYLDNPELESSIKIESQKLNLDISKREFVKQQSLFEKGGVTERELRNAERAYIDAKYAYENAKLQLEKMIVRAPFDGIIVDLPYYTPGTKVTANSPIATVMDYRTLVAEINLPQKELPHIATRQKVSVTNYTLPTDTLWGVIDQVSPAIDPDSRTFKATLSIDNPHLLMRPGMFVNVNIIVARKDSAIVIPRDVMLYRRGSKRVFVVEKGAAIERRIETGIENRDEVEVTNGLNENERLVVKGFETLRHRTRVKIVR